MRYFLLIIFLVSCQISTLQAQKIPSDFVDLQEEIPNIILDIRYAGNNNFVGRPIVGYKTPKAILHKKAAAALKKVQKELNKQGYSLKVYDAYRPQHSVNYFVSWAKDEADTIMKQQFYPDVEKEDLFRLGYIASQSGHSRGSTVDVTLIHLSGKEVDMGSNYDFFGKISNHGTELISKQQEQNRQILKSAMLKYGFAPYQQEWWHYTFQPEPYPETYFNFAVE